MITKFLMTSMGLMSMSGDTIWGQVKPPSNTSCIYIPNNISVRCDDYNKDFNLEIGCDGECRIQKMEVFSTWGVTLFSKEVPRGNGIVESNQKECTWL